MDRPIETFAIGMEDDAIDLKYARQVAEFIGSNHHELIMTKEEVLSSLEEVIAELATFDITTIRASHGYVSPLQKDPGNERYPRASDPVRFPMSCSGTNTPTSPPPLKNSRKKARSVYASCICMTFCEPTGAFPPIPWKPGSPLEISISSPT